MKKNQTLTQSLIFQFIQKLFKQRKPPLSFIVDIAKFYDVSADYLLGLDEY